MMQWKTSRRAITFDRPLVMGILNVTPDSFSDGGKFVSVETAVRHAERMIADGAEIIDIGGESTRPGSKQILPQEEILRVVPVIEAIVKNFDIPISIDTTKSDVARAAIDAGAEIINDISGLRFDERIGNVAADSRAGLILMHSRGDFGSMHSLPPIDDIVADVIGDFRRCTEASKALGVLDEQIVLDVGIGFGKTQEQNLELIAKLDKIAGEFEIYPIMIGTSRKSFIGKVLIDAPPDQRLAGSLATALTAVRNGARIVRVHDVKETVNVIKVAQAIEEKAV